MPRILHNTYSVTFEGILFPGLFLLFRNVLFFFLCTLSKLCGTMYDPAIYFVPGINRPKYHSTTCLKIAFQVTSRSSVLMKKDHRSLDVGFQNLKRRSSDTQQHSWLKSNFLSKKRVTMVMKLRKNGITRNTTHSSVLS